MYHRCNILKERPREIFIESQKTCLCIYMRVTLSQLISKIHHECIHESAIKLYKALMTNVIVIHNLANGKYFGENEQVDLKSGISDDSCVSCF